VCICKRIQVLLGACTAKDQGYQVACGVMVNPVEIACAFGGAKSGVKCQWHDSENQGCRSLPARQVTYYKHDPKHGP